MIAIPLVHIFGQLGCRQDVFLQDQYQRDPFLSIQKEEKIFNAEGMDDTGRIHGSGKIGCLNASGAKASEIKYMVYSKYK